MTLRQRVNEILAELKQSHPQHADAISRIRVQISNRMTASAGRAQYYGNVIKISNVFFCLEENLPHLRNTVTHEVAHLLLGHGAGHGLKWELLHKSMGGTGERCHSMKGAVSRRRHEVSCTGCNEKVSVGPTVYKRILRGMQYGHRRCGGRLTVEKEIHPFDLSF